jgi:hypothetical protein
MRAEGAVKVTLNSTTGVSEVAGKGHTGGSAFGLR